MRDAERIFLQENGKYSSAPIFAAGFLAFCALAAFFIGALPLHASIWTIFLFAGVHNFMEFRYFLARMPALWGKSGTYYAIGIGGVSFLTTAYLLIYFTSGWLWSAETAIVRTASWNTVFVLWIALLFYLRGRQKPKTDWSFAFAVGLFTASFAWLAPHFFALALVYLHPCVALWFCERQIRRTKPEWVAAFRICLASLPIFLVLLWLASFNFQNLPAEDYLSWRIAQQAGGEILFGVSSHLLVATHVFLETIHYSVWILLIPLVDRRARPFKMKTIRFSPAKTVSRVL